MRQTQLINIFRNLSPNLFFKEIQIQDGEHGFAYDIHSVYLRDGYLVLAGDLEPENDFELVWTDLPYEEQMHRYPRPEPAESEKLMAGAAMRFLVSEIEYLNPSRAENIAIAEMACPYKGDIKISEYK